MSHPEGQVQKNWTSIKVFHLTVAFENSKQHEANFEFAAFNGNLSSLYNWSVIYFWFSFLKISFNFLYSHYFYLLLKIVLNSGNNGKNSFHYDHIVCNDKNFDFCLEMKFHCNGNEVTKFANLKEESTKCRWFLLPML